MTGWGHADQHSTTALHVPQPNLACGPRIGVFWLLPPEGSRLRTLSVLGMVHAQHPSLIGKQFRECPDSTTASPTPPTPPTPPTTITIAEESAVRDTLARTSPSEEQNHVAPSCRRSRGPRAALCRVRHPATGCCCRAECTGCRLVAAGGTAGGGRGVPRADAVTHRVPDAQRHHGHAEAFTVLGQDFAHGEGHESVSLTHGDEVGCREERRPGLGGRLRLHGFKPGAQREGRLRHSGPKATRRSGPVQRLRERDVRAVHRERRPELPTLPRNQRQRDHRPRNVGRAHLRQGRPGWRPRRLLGLWRRVVRQPAAGWGAGRAPAP